MRRASIYKPRFGRLLAEFPYRHDNREWLTSRLSCRPKWNQKDKRWEIARNHFAELVELLAVEFGEVHVIVEGSTRERCDTRCVKARGIDCTCSCAGRNHGGLTAPGWRLVGATTLITDEIVTAGFIYRP